MVHNATLDDALTPYFEISDFKPQVLPVNQTVTLLSLVLKDAKANLQLRSFIRLHSNASDFYLPVLCFNGKIVPVIPPQFSDGLDFGTLGIGAKRDVHFAVYNPNPLEVRIKGWGSNLTMSIVELMGSQEGNATEFFTQANFSVLPKTLLIKPNHFVIFRGLFYAKTFIHTYYEELDIPFRLRAAEGSISLILHPENILFHESFPSRITYVTLRIQSSFHHALTFESFGATPPDPRFIYNPPPPPQCAARGAPSQLPLSASSFSPRPSPTWGNLAFNLIGAANPTATLALTWIIPHNDHLQNMRKGGIRHFGEEGWSGERNKEMGRKEEEYPIRFPH
ncbi:unnamed protein product [Cyprideis torosa]|uniref:Uncharacterized protein n=1 Tax=Cyprideis torosa TaxID=163714 RepID=A0A7R8WJ84_9CRUS|nr:unnamed protein product [Cyprideis torosa]CAG0901672.1 unnamed protein product [Cyprideis torosa]